MLIFPQGRQIIGDLIIEGRRRRGRQDEMVGWHHRLDGHEFKQALRVGDGQGSLVCYSPWDHKESDTTWRLNSNNHEDQEHWDQY